MCDEKINFCNNCSDFEVCDCRKGWGDVSSCIHGPRIGVVVRKRRGAPFFRDLPRSVQLSSQPLKYACPKKHRGFVKNIFKLVENGQEEDL